MTRYAFSILVVFLFADCSDSRCAPGNVPNDKLQACVRVPTCDGGTVNERNECVMSQPVATNNKGGAGGTHTGTAGDSGGGNDMDRGQAGSKSTAGQAGEEGLGGSTAAARCGDGAVDSNETCDGNCPTRCDVSSGATTNNRCIVMKLEGAAKNCDAACVPTEITDCKKGDGCCPMGCDHGTDDDCSPTCGDGVLTGVEKCEPGTTGHPCPTMSDCDDHDPCTQDRVTGAECSAECAHTPIMRLAASCDDGDPCTDDMPIASSSSCAYECMHSQRRTPTGSCVDSDPCTDDTPEASTTRCAYECPHRRLQPLAADCNDGNPCTDDTPEMSATQCAYDCPHAALPTGTPCGSGGTCSASAKCEAPPERCGDGILTQNEECDPAAQGEVVGYSCDTSCKRQNRLTPCGPQGQCGNSPPSKCDSGYCRPLCPNLQQGALCEILPGATKNESICTNGACAWLCIAGDDKAYCGPNLWCDGTYCRVKP